MTWRQATVEKWTVEIPRAWVCWADLVTFVRRGGGLVFTGSRFSLAAFFQSAFECKLTC